MTLYSFYRTRHAGWIRLGRVGPGLHWKGPEERPLFSERNGYTKPFVRFAGWRVFYLSRSDRRHDV